MLFANSATGLKSVLELMALLAGSLALVASAGLGALSWFKIYHPPQTVSGLFGRNLLGIAAVVTFGVGGLLVAMSFDASAIGGALLIAVMGLTFLFLTIEAWVAARLYKRAQAHDASGWPRFLRGLSLALAGVFLVVAVSIWTVGFILLAADRETAERRGPDGEVRRYAEGCDKGDASDCNMLGLRRRHGSGTPKDVPGAVSAFDRACTLGAQIGCDNLGAIYQQGDDGVPRDDARAKAAFARGPEGPARASASAP